MHAHDFYEIFWLTNGRARHYINGEKILLNEGDCVFVRPHDLHGLQGVGEETHVVNIVIQSALVDRLEKRYGLGERYFGKENPFPQQVHFDARARIDLAQRATVLERGARTKLQIEAFLLPLLNDLSAEPVELPADAPDWLAQACLAARRPEVFRDGAAGFARSTGKAHAHVSRTVQKFLGKTPSDYINDHRMAYAARQLAGTADGLAEIAQDVGIANMSHFHRLFRDHFGMTPRQYRVTNQKGVVQPE
ncbi:helix-turn-helix transcriptional regulator [Aquimixticola soesokkakensis]|nr:helix-turn-helix domain-containing protein [Aquimixticola soesokkakensis]